MSSSKRLGSDESSEAERNGQTYQVVTRQYVLFPLHSGKLTLPGPVLDAEIAVTQSRGGDGRPTRASSPGRRSAHVADRASRSA